MLWRRAWFVGLMRDGITVMTHLLQDIALTNASPLPPDLSVIVPVYCEEQSIRAFLARIEPVLAAIGSYEIIFCLDPSEDRTEQVIEQEICRNPRIGLLTFSRRFGQPSATMAGILHCRGESCVVIDVDLQDPPELIAQLYDTLRQGFDVVYARRRSRKGETALKRAITHWGYRLINRIAEVEIPRDTGDFRIVSRRLMEELRRLPERHGFLRGMVAFVGFPQTQVEYDRDERACGTSKYNRFLGSMKIAVHGVVGFSTIPLSAMRWGGVAVAVAAAAVILMNGLVRLMTGGGGLDLTALLVLFVGGVQLAGMGLLGEYVGRIYEEVRRRPRFIVQRSINVAPPPDALGEE